MEASHEGLTKAIELNITCKVAFEPRILENVVSCGTVHATTIDGAVPFEDAICGICRPSVVGLIHVPQCAGGKQGQTWSPFFVEVRRQNYDAHRIYLSEGLCNPRPRET